jgi:hypothetical protein
MRDTYLCYRYCVSVAASVLGEATWALFKAAYLFINCYTSLVCRPRFKTGIVFLKGTKLIMIINQYVLIVKLKKPVFSAN